MEPPLYKLNAIQLHEVLLTDFYWLIPQLAILAILGVVIGVVQLPTLPDSITSVHDAHSVYKARPHVYKFNYKQQLSPL